jgi:hypothetical protein
MKTKLSLLAVALVAAGTMFAQPRVSIGIGVGGYGPGYYPPPAYARAVPPCPGPDYTWVDGYWGPQGAWIAGYWRPPYINGYRMAPGYVAPRYYNSFRGYDRDRDRGHEDRRGGERFENHGRGYSDSFRR